MTQREYMSILLGRNRDAVAVSSLGNIGNDLKEIIHTEKIFVKGAMGCAVAVGLGYALGRPDKHIIVFIGDGALLMKLGSIATVLRLKPKNLRIVVINNNKYGSCGGQETYFKDIKYLIPFEVFEPSIA